MKSKDFLKWGAIIGFIIIVGVGIGATFHIKDTVKSFENVFAKNIFVEGLDVGGLTKDEAKNKLKKNIEDSLKTKTLIIYDNSTEKSIPYSEIGITYSLDKALDSAFELSHKGNIWKKYQISKNGLDTPKEFTLDKKISDDKILAFIRDNSSTFSVSAKNASMVRKNGGFIITEETEGRLVDENTTLNDIKECLETSDAEIIKVPVSFKIDKPQYSSEIFEQSQTLIASFSTSYNNASANRNENLKVAAQKVSSILLPDEIFYLSNQLEPFTEAAGYKNAGVIINGKVEDGLGGGVCQVASTLYNAILLTDIEVVYRQNHSLPVAYVPLGRDATYATDVIDFKFKNNTGYPLTVEGYCKDNKVYVNLYGHKSFVPEYEVKFESVVTEVIPAPQTKYEEDTSLPAGKEVVQVKALDGKRVKLYKVYYQNGKVINKEVIDSSYYKPRAAVIKRNKNATPSPSPSASPKPEPSPEIPISTPTPSETQVPETSSTPLPTTIPVQNNDTAVDNVNDSSEQTSDFLEIQQ